MRSFAGLLAPVVILIAASCGKKPETPAVADAYAPKTTCVACHAEIAKSYQQTGMARAFRKASLFDAPDTAFTHEASGRTYRFAKREGKLFLRREGGAADALEKEIHYVLGSGNHARSFLHRTAQNRLIEMPVNWYPANGGYLAMSPGYDRPDHFDMRRAVGYECMFCHNGYPQLPEARSTDDPVFPAAMPEGIDCQRCHGPGAAHVKSPGRGTIFNPKTAGAERQMEVCMQCHLEPTSFPLPNSIVRFERGIFSYNPKEPLGAYTVHFDHAAGTGHDDKFEIASSAYRLRQSQCFVKSAGKLTCTTCHDPHRVTTDFDAACGQCHQNVAGHAGRTGCANCHMPKRRTEDVVQVAMTDHRIQRPPRDPKALLAPRAERHETMGADSYRGEVKLYYPAQVAGDLYPALAQVAHMSNLEKGIPRLAAALEKEKPQHPAYYLQMAAAYHAAGNKAQALTFYRRALEKDPGYLPALRSMGATQAQMGQAAEGQETLERAVKAHPEDSLAWLELARVYRQSGKGTEAAGAARKAIANEPELADAHLALGLILLDAADRAGAETSFRATLREKPDDGTAHMQLGNLLAAKGSYAEAEKHFAESVRRDPKSALARYNLAVFLANLRRYSDAIPYAKEAVALDPANLNQRDLLGNLYAAARQWREAVALYQETLRLNPAFPRAQLGLGTALGAMNDFRGARTYLTQAAQGADPAVRAEALELLQSLPR